MATAVKDITRKKLALYTTLEVIGVLSLTIISGAFDWLNMRFDFTQLATLDYWIGVLQCMLCYSIALALGLLSTLEKEELRNEEYLKRLDTYRELLKSKNHSFTDYIDNTLNPEIKKIAMRELITRKLYRLDRHSKDEWKLGYKQCKEMDDETFKFDFKPTAPSKFRNLIGRIIHGINYKDKYHYSWRVKLYCMRRRKFEKMASEQYIEENWEYTSIKYQHVNPNVFTWSIRMSDSKMSEYQVENHAAKSVTLAMLRKMLTVALTSIVLASIIYDASVSELIEQANGWLGIMIKYVIRVIMIIVNYIFGIFTGKKVFYMNFIHVLINRTRILRDYIDWKHKNGIQDSWADKLLETYRKNQEIKSSLESAIAKAEGNTATH